MDIQKREKEIFSKNLDSIMKSKSITQSDIVRDLEITASTVSDWVNAKKYPRVDKMQRLADYLGVLLSDLRDESTYIKEHPLSEHELKVLKSYRSKPEIQQYIDKLLDVEQDISPKHIALVAARSNLIKGVNKIKVDVNTFDDMIFDDDKDGK